MLSFPATESSARHSVGTVNLCSVNPLGHIPVVTGYYENEIIGAANHHVPTSDQLLPFSQDPWPFSWRPLLPISLTARALHPYPPHDNLPGGFRGLRGKPSKTPSLVWSPSLLTPLLHVPSTEPEPRAQWSNSLTSQLIRLRSSEERGLAQGHIIRTPGPIFPAPRRHHHAHTRRSPSSPNDKTGKKLPWAVEAAKGLIDLDGGGRGGCLPGAKELWGPHGEHPA